MSWEELMSSFYFSYSILAIYHAVKSTGKQVPTLIYFESYVLNRHVSLNRSIKVI